jgi:GNAT superfamily N-acetyltransferase
MALSDLVLATKTSLTPSELADADALVREARWNQLTADWRVFIEYGRVYAAQTTEGRIVATTATLPYGARFAWISMVLVTGDYRRRGLATQLLRLAMADLAAARLVPVLDATPDGHAVYRRLGFEDCWGFHRLVGRERRPAPLAALASEASGQRGDPIVRAPDTRPEPGSSARAALASEASDQRGNSIVRAHSASEDARERADDIRPEPGSSARAAPAGVTVRAITDADWPALTAYDAAAFGAERGAVLAGLRGRLPAAELIASRNGRIAGFLLGRDGGLASQVGPLIADDDTVACALAARALDRLDGPVFVDLADGKSELRSFLDGCGFAVARPFTRMAYRSSARFDDAARTFAVAGPEFG